jgi:hypothetical protein
MSRFAPDAAVKIRSIECVEPSVLTSTEPLLGAGSAIVTVGAVEVAVAEAEEAEVPEETVGEAPGEDETTGA